jgi:ABC-2 type transport system permease protein
MTAFFGLFKKEMTVTWGGWAAWIVLFSFHLITSVLFWLRLLQYEKIVQKYEQYKDQILLSQLNFDDVIIKYLFVNMSVVLLFMIPIITMRSFAEERQLGTYEWLRAQPINSGTLLAAKFLSALSFIVLLALMTLTYPLVLEKIGTSSLVQSSVIDWPATVLGMGGLLALGSVFIAIGLFFSSWGKNQLVAALLSFLFLLLIWFFKTAGQEVSAPLGPVLIYISPLSHIDSFSRGVLRLDDLVYFISATSFFLWLAHQKLESDGWES